VIHAVVKKGKVLGETVPAPNVSEGSILIKVVNSCISAGTEMSNVAETGKPLIKRALEQPAEVRNVLNFARENGLRKTLARIRGTLDGGKPTGYSVSGIVIGVGAGVTNFNIGDRVAAAGQGIANHAEYVDVPINLAMHIPKGLDYVDASTVTLGGIAMQGVRRAELNLGEIAVVVGAGVLGLLTAQMLNAAGVRVVVTDIDERRLELASKAGAELTINPTKSNPIDIVNSLSGGYGADAVIFTAATQGNEALSQSFKMCKKKGRVVLVGVSGMEINRGDIYAKELDFLISTSYGPGRYDSTYEDKGVDYPYAYVRWTENRNMTEYLRLLAAEKIQIKDYIDATYPIEQVEEAFDNLKSVSPKPILTILDYGNDVNIQEPERLVRISSEPKLEGKLAVALIGAGTFATGTHLPNLKRKSADIEIRAIVNRTGQKAKAVAEQYGAAYATTNVDEVLSDETIDAVVISTRHASHAKLILDSLKAGKHVLVEKPLCVNREELEEIDAWLIENESSCPVLMVGFNRRFSPLIQEIRNQTKKRSNPMVVQYRMNAGYIPLDHWVHEDGGRIIGEGCHIIDLMTSLTGGKITSISTECITPTNDKYSAQDNRNITLKYDDGSICNIQYFATGNKAISKEYMEIHFDQNSIVMDDYKSVKGYGCKVKSFDLSISNKGHFDELDAFLQGIRTGAWPIDWWDIKQTTLTTFAIEE